MAAPSAIAGDEPAAGMEPKAEELGILRRAAASSFPPLHAVHHLLSVGVCVRCILRMFGAFTYAYACTSLTETVLHSFLEEHDNSAEKGSCSCLPKDETYCCVCLGVLQPTTVDDFTMMISEVVRRENHQVDDFSLEISLPPIIAANERAIRLYMSQKYGNEEWFRDKFLYQQEMSVKEALKLLLVKPLENQMNVKSNNSSFRIRLTYTHADASQKLQKCFPNNHSHKRKNESRDHGPTFDQSLKNNSKEGEKQPCSESDSVIHKNLERMQDQDFCRVFQVPPEKVFKPCRLVTTCQRSPIYVGGRYLKLSRNVSQSRWIIDDERMGEASVEEIIGESVCVVCRGDSYKFHAAGREDIDVRMLGSGRPFLVEVLNPRSRPSDVEIEQIVEKINNSDKKYVRVRNLKLVGSEIWSMMREGEAEKQKQYAALIWTSRLLTGEDLNNISNMKNVEIIQKTPVRVLHRRSPLERKRTIHWMSTEKVAGSSNYYLLHLCTQAGTYIKEFVHGDLGRTYPSIGSILGCRAEILQLDVTDVKMDILE